MLFAQSYIQVKGCTCFVYSDKMKAKPKTASGPLSEDSSEGWGHPVAGCHVVM